VKLRPYGTGALFSTALLDGAGDPPGVAFASPTLVAGDLKRVTDLLPLGNLTAEFAAFTSGSEQPAVGDTVANNSETAVVIGTVVTSGTWGGGDAAGFIFLEQVSGTLASGQVDISGGTSDVMTLSGDATPSIGGVAAGTVVWYGLTSAEMTCKQGHVQIADQGASVWAADGMEFETVGGAGFHPDVVGDLTDAAASGAVTATDTLMAYVKQLVTEGIARDTAIGTAQDDLDILTGTDGATLATSQGNYAPATAAALVTVDGNVDAIKLVTDGIQFGVGNAIDANVTHVNEVAVTGDGEEGTEWGPA
jgi:hypothetical protein